MRRLTGSSSVGRTFRSARGGRMGRILANQTSIAIEGIEEPDKSLFFYTACRYVNASFIPPQDPLANVFSTNHHTRAPPSEGSSTSFQQQIPRYCRQLRRYCLSGQLTLTTGSRIRCDCCRCRRCWFTSSFWSCRGRFQHCLYIEALPYSKSYRSCARWYQCCSRKHA